MCLFSGRSVWLYSRETDGPSWRINNFLTYSFNFESSFLIRSTCRLTVSRSGIRAKLSKISCLIPECNAIQLTATNNPLPRIAWFTSALLLRFLTVVECHAISIVVASNSLTSTITWKKSTAWQSAWNVGWCNIVTNLLRGKLLQQLEKRIWDILSSTFARTLNDKNSLQCGSSKQTDLFSLNQLDFHLGFRCDPVVVAGRWLRDHGTETKNNFHSVTQSLK